MAGGTCTRARAGIVPMNDRQALLELVVAMRARLEWWRDTGLEVGAPLPASPPATAPLADAADDGARREAAGPAARGAATAEVNRPSPPREVERCAATSTELRAAIGDCHALQARAAPHATSCSASAIRAPDSCSSARRRAATRT